MKVADVKIGSLYRFTYGYDYSKVKLYAYPKKVSPKNSEVGSIVKNELIIPLEYKLVHHRQKHFLVDLHCTKLLASSGVMGWLLQYRRCYSSFESVEEDDKSCR